MRHANDRRRVLTGAAATALASALTCLLAPVSSEAQAPRLVRDIRPGPGIASSEPSDLVATSGGIVIFRACSEVAEFGGSANCELWRSDGTAAGTVLVKDILPGSGSSFPSNLELAGTRVYFTADDGVHGRELWRTDGTPAGTVMIRDLRPGTFGSDPYNLTLVGGTLYFGASDESAGTELWKTNGTTTGTVRVSDIVPGATGSSPANLTDVNGTLFFTASGPAGRELWRTDGTDPGTILVKDVVPGSSSSNPSNLTSVNGRLLFAAFDSVNGVELWKSDGTEAGTTIVKDIAPSGWSSPENLTVVGALVYFRANDSTHGIELWRSDGTEAGTTLVRDIATTGSSFPNNLTNVNGVLYFAAQDGTNGTELWRSNGTEAGTTPIEIRLGPAGSIPEGLTNVNGTLYFRAEAASGGIELFTSDGTLAGTRRVADIAPGSGSSFPQWITNLAGKVVFTASDGTGRELWRSDGTTGGTVLVLDLLQNGASSLPANLTDFFGTLFFTADDGTTGFEPWSSAGTTPTTTRVGDILPGLDGSSPRLAQRVNGSLLFFAEDNTPDIELWRAVPGVAGATLVKDVVPTSGFPFPSESAVVGSTYYFLLTANSGFGSHELWRSDGTSTGTVLVRTLPMPAGSFLRPSGLTNLNGTLLFSAEDDPAGFELWRSDGTALGTVRLKDIRPGPDSSFPGAFTTVGNIAFFIANDGVLGRELWKTDGTDAGTVIVKDIIPGLPSPADFGSFTVVGSTLFFVADDGTYGSELWRSDGTAAGTVLVKDINPSGGSSPDLLTDVDGILYFVADDGTSGRELWRSDGTGPGTVLVADLRPGSATPDIRNLAGANGVAFFTADDGVRGVELWRSDGTALGTLPAGDIRPGLSGSYPNSLFRAGAHLYMSADDGIVGRELWAIGLPSAQPGAFATAEDVPLSVPVPGALHMATDPDGDALSAVLVTGPAHGSLFLNANGSFIYTPDGDWNGVDSFTYRASDGVAWSGNATVTITVSPVNDAPRPEPESYVVNEDAVLTVAAPGVLANDFDPEGNTLGALLGTIPTQGSFVLGLDGSFTYAPAADYFGPDTFTYVPWDGLAPGSPAAVSLAVRSVNDAPSFVKGVDLRVRGYDGAVVTPGWATAIRPGPANESGQALAFQLTPANPALFSSPPALSVDGTLTFTPVSGQNGATAVAVVLRDDGGTANGGVDTSAPQFFTIQVVDLTVNTTSDTDDTMCNAAHCSLREAIGIANSSSGHDTIRFRIPGGGPHTIRPLAPLPVATGAVDIDGSTQPGYSGTPVIELDGSLAGPAIGLRVADGPSLVRALAINRFQGHGILLAGGAGGSRIEACHIGVNVAGLAGLPNTGSGIVVSASNGNVVDGNVISGNGQSGVRLETNASDNVVKRNRIGAGADGVTPLGNGQAGVILVSSAGNTIGTGGAGEGNTIAFNGGHGVQVSSGTRNRVRGNSIHANALLGIELGADGVTANDATDTDAGANDLQNYPVLELATASATTTGVKGTLRTTPGATSTLDFYRSDACDASGYGEGALHLGSALVTTDSSGSAAFALATGLPAVAPGSALTATATSADGSTSELSACRAVEDLPTLDLDGGTGTTLQTTEGDSPAGGTQVLTFFVRLSRPSALPVSVAYATADGSAIAPFDYVGLSGAHSFVAGETVKTVFVQTLLDTAPEADEDFRLSLSSPTNARLGAASVRIVLVDDDGAAGPLAFSAVDTAATEPRTGSRTVDLAVRLNDPAPHTTRVNYRTVDGTAQAGTDYTAASGQLTFLPRETEKTVSVQIQSDTAREGKEAFLLVLSDPVDAVVGKAQGTVTIADPGSLYTLAPCRLVDTRLWSGALGGPGTAGPAPLGAGELRTFTFVGRCGIPASALALSVNVTVTEPQAVGFFEAFPAHLIAPPTSVLNFARVQTRANNGIVGLSPAGQTTFKNVSAGTAHLVLDVNGYFE